MSDREMLWMMLNRTSALADRLSNSICARIASCERLDELDELFTLSERTHCLFQRIYRRYDAACVEN